ncbi:hypothetical protein PYCCODRAFT_1436386 [Trametes coccinea BRFM310]|uniref:Uncharacterized protein n=1 Tax=Trametes coccinea (strain BRFM310) TaxID=1353009 RepID=A0A1Y2IJY0_TRAC3|nr:hypothetical protein PYCCODRAFT_1436386 [Trametes coccinea BRFM310]
MSHEAPSWTPLSMMSASMGPAPLMSPAEQSPSARPGRYAQRRRYPSAAYDLLIDFYDNHPTKYPKKYELELLAARIRALPGCEDYTAEKASTYIAGRRQNKGDAVRGRGPKAAASSSAQILYPSLANHASVVAKLDVLLNETPEPSAELARIWANRLGRGVAPEDILTYADLKRIQRRHGNSAGPPRVPVASSQLPTPESSTSPEPHSTPTSPVVETSWGKVDSEDEVKDELQDDEYEEEIASPEQYDPRCVLVAEEFSKALGLPTPNPGDGTSMPKSFADLTKWFREQTAATSLLDTLGKPNSQQQSTPLKPSGGRMPT